MRVPRSTVFVGTDMPLVSPKGALPGWLNSRIRRAASPRAFALTGVLLLAGCATSSYQIRYELSPTTLAPAERTAPLVVRVGAFTDRRPDEEKSREARAARGGGGVGNYTYDDQFEGRVADEISKMVAAHLAYAKVFRAVEFAPIGQDAVTPRTLDSLKTAGVDALLVGDVTHFYGFYDQNFGRAFLLTAGLAVASGLLLNFDIESGGGTYNVSWYGPGLLLGFWLDSRFARRLEHASQLRMRLVSTTTHNPIWEETIDVANKTSTRASGFVGAKRKNEVAVESLRDAVRSMAVSLSQLKAAEGRQDN